MTTFYFIKHSLATGPHRCAPVRINLCSNSQAESKENIRGDILYVDDVGDGEVFE
jgi:hypothetical protein